MSSGAALFMRAEVFYAQGKIDDAFSFYQKSIKTILKSENVTAKIPSIVPDDCPQETLGAVWRNFVGFFRDATMSFTQESAPDAYKLLNIFRPSAPKPHARLERTPRAKILMKGMQVTAGLTLGLLAWDKRDRVTAAKLYKEALTLAETHKPFLEISPKIVGLERWVYHDLQQIKENLDYLVQNDTLNAQLLGGARADGGTLKRKDVVDLPLPQVRIDKSGGMTLEESVTIATNACANCGTRGVKLMRCSLCKKVSYCGLECQKADWKAHKASSCTGKV